MLEVKSLTFTHEGQNQICFPDISLSNNEGLIVLGSSGSGKTTLINLIAGLIKPDSGDITLNQTKYNELSLDDLDIFRGKNIGLIFKNLTLLEILMFWRIYHYQLICQEIKSERIFLKKH